MVAYVAGNLLLLPLLHLTGAISLVYGDAAQPCATGFLSGILFTGIVSLSNRVVYEAGLVVENLIIQPGIG